MIISASYKTDIPAFYGDWFVRRLQAGYVGMVNAYNRQAYRISLDPGFVTGFVFWTKNLRPFIKHLDAVAEFGAPAYVQFTINGYPTKLETAIVDWRKSVEAAKIACDILGDRAIVWRYDPVVLSSITPWPWHIENFQRIADAMAGLTDEVVLSFVQLYRKTKLNLDAALEPDNYRWWTPSEDDRRNMALELSTLALDRGIRPTICSQPELITIQNPSRCIDSARLSDLAGRDIRVATKGNRPGCECAESKDIGEYDTCPHGCVYCYAVRNQSTAIGRFREHDPDSEYLFRHLSLDSKEIQIYKNPQLRFDV